MRITIQDEALDETIKFLKEEGREDLATVFLLAKKNAKEANSKRVNATKEANETRTKASMLKVQNAINLLRMENKNITAYAISKVSGVTINTAKKYLLRLGITE